LNALLLDTCAVIWLFNGSPISDEAKAAIAQAARDDTLYVSPFSAWEIGMLAQKKRIALTMSATQWFSRVVDHPSVTLASLSPDLLIESSFLPDEPPGDPADRIVIATARKLGAAIVTRDRPILSYARKGHVPALAC
jgi:PIN domain nuclease of toxin-antitoxin system